MKPKVVLIDDNNIVNFINRKTIESCGFSDNILEYTSAKKAFVSVLNQDSTLLLQIGNEANPRLPGVENFTPRSIHERVEALGGQTVVDHRDDGYTVVNVTIPM